MTILLRWWYRIIKKSPADMNMVKYWKTKQSVSAIITKAENGSTVMKMEGEDYPFPTYPRGYLLIGENGKHTVFSTLKHQIKNKIFNEAWAELEAGKDKREIIDSIKYKLANDIPAYYEPMRFDAIPFNRMCPSVREIYRAWTKVKGNDKIRDYLCFILQEDDAYRFRVQWLAEWFGWAGWLVKLWPIKFFEKALLFMEHAEVIGDMKERIRLLRRILMLVLEDERIKDKFTKFIREIDFKKFRLSAGDKYHFRGKYFKVDYRLFDY